MAIAPGFTGSDDLPDVPDLDLPTTGAGPFDDLDLPAARAVPASPFAPGVLDKRSSAGAASPAPGTPFDDFDLPAPAPQASAPATPFDELGDFDLPAPVTPAASDPLDLPAPAAASAFGGGDGDGDGLDLPQLRGSIDLPTPRQASAGFGDLDLPLPSGATQGGGQNAFGDLDLPAVQHGIADLPMPQSGHIDLPAPQAPGGGTVDLPDLLRSDLPGLSPDLPAPQAPGGGLLDLPEPQIPGHGSSDLPVPRAPGGGAMDLPVPSSNPPGPDGSPFGEIELGPTVPESMEFDALPQESPDGFTPEFGGDLSLPEPGAQDDDEEAPVAAKKRRIRVSPALAAFLGIAVVVLGAGAALGTTPYGYFGMFFLEQYLPAAGNDAEVKAAIKKAETLVGSDSYADTRAALKTLSEARASAGLNRMLLARSLLHERLFQVRFQETGSSAGRAARIVARLEQRGFDAPGIGVARAADALQRGELAVAETFLAGGGLQDPLASVVAAEIALAKGDHDKAIQSFQKVVEAGMGGRGHWGRVRVLLAKEDLAGAKEAVLATLEASPNHAAALNMLGRLHMVAGEMEAAAEAATRSTQLAQDGRQVSRADQAEAWALRGRMHEDARERPQARAAYEHALELDDLVVDALLGAGRLFLTEGRYRDALARFQAVVGSQQVEVLRLGEERSVDVQARLGAAEAMIALDEATAARALLQELQATGSEDALVVLNLGKIAEALDDFSDAERNYREAIRIAPQQFGPYLALAELFLGQERSDAAEEILDHAQEQVEESAATRRAMGHLKLSQDDPQGALAEYRRSLELGPKEPATLFGLGVTLRHLGKLAEADEAFQALTDVDSGWTGLSLERGRVFEAQGKGDRAVRAYEAALAENPEDLDLELRLGAALVVAGRIDEGEEKLQKVLDERPNSVEAQHFMGRVHFERGDLQEAMMFFTRAVALDASRAEFHLYVAWVAAEQGKLGQALEAIEETIELDPTLADAFWLRARLRVRTGASKDALEDIEKALELNPDRAEFFATMGDAYEQRRKLREAVDAYENALGKASNRGEWWARLGQLHMDAGSRADAAQALAKATELGDALAAPPVWLAGAHRLRGETFRLAGNRGEAAKHYNRYLELAEENAIDRADVMRFLDRWGLAPEAP